MPPIAKKGDVVFGLDTHVCLLPVGPGTAPTPISMPFSGKLTSSLADYVKIDDQPVAVVGSEASNQPRHVCPAGQFMQPPSDKARVIAGSGTVMAEDKPVARSGDAATSCDDLGASGNSHVIATSSVLAD